MPNSNEQRQGFGERLSTVWKRLTSRSRSAEGESTEQPTQSNLAQRLDKLSRATTGKPILEQDSETTRQLFAADSMLDQMDEEVRNNNRLISPENTGLQQAEMARMMQLSVEDSKNPNKRNEQRIQYQIEMARQAMDQVKLLQQKVDAGEINPGDQHTLEVEYSNAEKAVLTAIDFIFQAMKIELDTERKAIQRGNDESESKYEEWRQKVYGAEKMARERIALLKLPDEILDSDRVQSAIRTKFTADIREAVF